MEILSPSQVKEKVEANAKLNEFNMRIVNDEMIKTMTKGETETLVPLWHFDSTQCNLIIMELKRKGWNAVETVDDKGTKVLKISP